MGRLHIKQNGQWVLAHKGWRDLKQSQVVWILQQCQQLMQEAGSASEDDRLTQLVERVRQRGIRVSEKELRQQARTKMRRLQRRDT